MIDWELPENNDFLLASQFWVAGELYLKRPDLTAEKFISHPYKSGERLYRTGDLARWLSDGTIEYLGRMDHQLKIRGYRIEAGEIEHALLTHPAIQSAVVVGYETEGGKELAAYLVAARGQTLPDSSVLRQHLSATLPDYMLPAYFVSLEQLPLNSSGKIDRRALPAPNQNLLSTGTAYTGARNEKESTLLTIWESVLRRTGMSIHDNFFQAGGDSIKAIQVTSRLSATGWQLSMKDFFGGPTIAQQAERFSHRSRSYEQGRITGPATGWCGRATMARWPFCR